MQAGVRMKQVSSPAKLIYPSSAHDYSYYKSSTVAYFMIDEIKASLCRVLCPPSVATVTQ
jgi:kinesin family protein 4/21/27